MHELAVTESILEIAMQEAVAHAASKVTDIYLSLGQLSSIVDESVQFYWMSSAKGRSPNVLSCTSPISQHAYAAKTVERNLDLTEELTPCPSCQVLLWRLFRERNSKWML
jgi:hydrogenase nickel incorporation protein HypA/HybF